MAECNWSVINSEGSVDLTENDVPNLVVQRQTETIHIGNISDEDDEEQLHNASDKQNQEAVRDLHVRDGSFSRISREFDYLKLNVSNLKDHQIALISACNAQMELYETTLAETTVYGNIARLYTNPYANLNHFEEIKTMLINIAARQKMYCQECKKDCPASIPVSMPGIQLNEQLTEECVASGNRSFIIRDGVLINTNNSMSHDQLLLVDEENKKTCKESLISNKYMHIDRDHDDVEEHEGSHIKKQSIKQKAIHDELCFLKKEMKHLRAEQITITELLQKQMMLTNTKINEMRQIKKDVQLYKSKFNGIEKQFDDIKNILLTIAKNQEIQSQNCHISAMKSCKTEDKPIIEGQSAKDLKAIADPSLELGLHIGSSILSATADSDSKLGATADSNSQLGATADSNSKLGTTADSDSELGSTADSNSQLGATGDSNSKLGTTDDLNSELGKTADSDSELGATANSNSKLVKFPDLASIFQLMPMFKNCNIPELIGQISSNRSVGDIVPYCPKNTYTYDYKPTFTITQKMKNLENQRVPGCQEHGKIETFDDDGHWSFQIADDLSDDEISDIWANVFHHGHGQKDIPSVPVLLPYEFGEFCGFFTISPYNRKKFKLSFKCYADFNFNTARVNNLPVDINFHFKATDSLGRTSNYTHTILVESLNECYDCIMPFRRNIMTYGTDLPEMEIILQQPSSDSSSNNSNDT